MPIEVTETHWFKDRCQGRFPRPGAIVPFYQCDDVNGHLGSHHHAVSDQQIILWPSEADIEEARADAEFNELTDEQVMLTLTGGDEEERKKVEEWASASAKFIQAGFRMRKEIDDLRKELAAYKEKEENEKHGERAGSDGRGAAG